MKTDFAHKGTKAAPPKAFFRRQTLASRFLIVHPFLALQVSPLYRNVPKAFA